MKFNQSAFPLFLVIVVAVLVHSSFGQTETDLNNSSAAGDQNFGLENITSFLEALQQQQNEPSNETNASQNLISGSDYDELDGWEAPLEIQKNYPFFLSGYDDENRPIWVAELGKFDMRKLVEGGKETMEAFRTYVKKLIGVMLKSIKARSTPEAPVDRGIFIVDFDELKLLQLAHLPTISYCLGLMRQYRHLIEDHMDKVHVLNANFVAESALNLARPILGHMFTRFEIYGTNKARWLPKLLRALPRDQLPEWYGGPKDHKPLIIYG